MARTMDPTAKVLFSPNKPPFATNWTQDSWYNVYSWVNSQSNTSENGDSIRSSTSSQPQTSPQSASGLFTDDRDHPLLRDSPYERFENNENMQFLNNNLCNATDHNLNQNYENTLAAQNDWYSAAHQQLQKQVAAEGQQNFSSDYNLIHELLKLNLNTTTATPSTAQPQPQSLTQAPRRPSSNQLFSSTSPSTSSPWSLPPDEPTAYRPAPITSRSNSTPQPSSQSIYSTWNQPTPQPTQRRSTQTPISSGSEFDIFSQLTTQLAACQPSQTQQQPSGVDMTYIMQQQQQQQAALVQQAAQQQNQQANTSWPATKMVAQRYNMAVQLQSKLDEVSEEYRQLEKERKQTEAELARHNLGKKISSSNAVPIPRLPQAPSRVDRLIVDFFREHARISTLLSKMEQLGNAAMPATVHHTLAELKDSNTLLQHVRSHERSTILQQLRGENVHYDEEKEASEMCHALSLVRRAATRVRAANWCSLINTLTPVDEIQKAQVDRIIASDYTIPPPPIRPRPINI